MISYIATIATNLYYYLLWYATKISSIMLKTILLRKTCIYLKLCYVTTNYLAQKSKAIVTFTHCIATFVY